jgi:hypothetical protein
MRWNDIDFNPSTRSLRQFALVWILFFSAMALWAIATSHNRTTVLLCLGAALGGIAGLVKPPMLRPIYVGWMVLVFPPGWLVSHVLLAFLYFCLFTPLGLILRIGGRDALRLRRMECFSYWQPKPTPLDLRRYFRPF